MWEPDTDNIRVAKKVLKRYHDINIIPYGMSDRHKSVSFADDAGGVSHIVESSDNDSCIKIECQSLDNIYKDIPVTFIKMDIEGSEVDALNGGEKIIQKYRPKLAICVYHKLEHLYQIPFLIKKIVPDYKLYLRHYAEMLAETVVYAIPPENIIEKDS